MPSFLPFLLAAIPILPLVAGLFARGSLPAVAAWLTTHPMTTTSTWDAELLYLLMTLLMAAVVMRPTVPALGHPALVHVGRISYGIYLLHMLVICVVKKMPYGTSPWICYGVSTAAVIAIASVVYTHFELPIIQFYKRRLHPDQTRPTLVPQLPTQLETEATGSGSA